MLANDAASIKVSDALSKNLKKSQILIDMSSTKKKTAVTIAKKVKANQAHFLDAPVSGGTSGAKNSKLAIMVGGEKKIFNKTKNLFGTMGKATYVGKTMHKVDEAVSVSDLKKLTHIYQNILINYFK